MNILIIGNGFDLAHGLKTSYSDFINYVRGEHEKDEDKFTQFYAYKTIPIDPYKNTPRRRKLYPNGLYRDIESQTIKSWCDIEAFYYNRLQSIEKAEELNKQFQEIKEALYNYLSSQDALSQPISGYAEIFQRLTNSQSCIVNFNYTDTLRHYPSIRGQVIHLHGRLNDEANAPIFGYAAKQEETLKLLEKDDDNFLENIKQYEYLNTNNFEHLNDFLSKQADKRVFILGHSCGLSDQLIMKRILENEDVHSIYNFYYKNVINHKKKLINRTTNENVGFSKFKPFPNCIRMPQIDDDLTSDEVDQFMYLNKLKVFG